MKKHQQTKVLSNSILSYDDVFSQDVMKQKEVTELFSELLKIREPVAITGFDLQKQFILSLCDV